MTNIKLGNIFEIITPKGKGYLHYIFKDNSLGELVSILPSLYDNRPLNFDELAMMKERYTIFFPVIAATKKNIIENVGFYPPDDFNKPEYKRTPHSIEGQFLGWHIINTDTWHRQLEVNLSEDKKQLSPWGIFNDTLLIEYLINDWSLENWK